MFVDIVLENIALSDEWSYHVSFLQTLYSYPNNPRAQLIQISAQYGGSDVKLAADFAFGVTNKSPEFTAKFPFGQVCKKFRITIKIVNTLFAEMRY